MSAFFRRVWRGGWLFPRERLMVILDDGERVIVANDEGNRMLVCSRWLFDQCWKCGYFEDAD